MHDDRCYTAELKLMYRYFSALGALRMRSISSLNSWAVGDLDGAVND